MSTMRVFASLSARTGELASNQNAHATINHTWTEIKVRDNREEGVPPKPSPGAALAVMAFQPYEIKQRKKTASGPYEQVRSIVHASLKAREDRFLWDGLPIPVDVSIQSSATSA